MQHAKLRFKESMRWEGPIEDFVREKVYGYVLNAPCGESSIGDVRVDIAEKPNVTHACDFFHIPFPNETFDCVVSDPIWKFNYYERPRWFFKAVDLCKVGGTIIYNAPWVPTSRYVQLIDAYWRQSATFSNVSMLSIFKKIAPSPPFDYFAKEKKLAEQ